MDKAAHFSMASVIRPMKSAILLVGILSGLINLLALTGSMYMLQVYDRVLPSRSIPTLVGLTFVMLILFAGLGAFEFVRTRIMSRVGLKIEEELRGRVLDAVLIAPLRAGGGADTGVQPIRDLDAIRIYLSGLGPTAIFDLPWLPLFIIMMWLMHAWLGWFALGSTILLIILTILTEVKTGKPMQASGRSGFMRSVQAEAARRNAEVIRAMGMGPRIHESYGNANARYLNDQIAVADAASGIGAVSRVVRLVLQSLMLGLGAWLAVRGEVSAGGIIAGSILLGRALAPVELAIANWKGMVSARESYRRLQRMFAATANTVQRMSLPRPSRALQVEALSVGAPGSSKPIILNVNFALKAGDGLGIIGPSASGKSTLVRALVGAWLPLPRGGQVRLDSAALDQYDAVDLGRDIGYLPQAIELFDGTISENIARLDPKADSDNVIAAAKAAGCHEMILTLPDGYNMRIGESGSLLSAGQRQRIALARALYGDPFLVILDEPNSNLDAVGDAAVTEAVRSVRARGGIVIVVAHRQSALVGIDLLLAMGGGQVQAFGPRQEVIDKITAQHGQKPGQKPAAAQVRPAQNVVTTATFGPRGGMS